MQLPPVYLLQLHNIVHFVKDKKKISATKHAKLIIKSILNF